MKTKSKVMFGLGFAVVTAVTAIATFTWALPNSHAATPAPQIKVQDTPLPRDGRLTTSFAPVIKKVGPSVVNVYTSKTIRLNPRNSPGMDNPWRRFFGNPFEDEDSNGSSDSGTKSRRPRTREANSLGSGVIISEDGYILTNNHVVDGADEVKVALSDGKHEYVAKVVGTDPQTDVAVLKVDAKGLPAITLADSSKLEVGDVALAIGNPFGIGQTVTMGIVSAMSRGGFGLVDYEDFIQTDASINPGNSGGALTDAEGRLIGINTWIMSETGGNQGVGFAIPVNLARYVMERLITDGKVTRGYLGVIIQPVTPDLAKQFNLPAEQRGALVGEVQPKTPAADAGLKEGDIIVELNGKKVEDERHLRLAVSQTPPKAKVTLTALRDGKEKKFSVSLGELPEKTAAAKGIRKSNREPENTKETLDGVEVGEDSRVRRQFDVPQSMRGAVVTNVDPDSPCYRAGIRPGDVILEVNKKTVRNADEAVEASKGITGKVLLRVWSKGGSHYIVVDNGKGQK